MFDGRYRAVNLHHALEKLREEELLDLPPTLRTSRENIGDPGKLDELEGRSSQRREEHQRLKERAFKVLSPNGSSSIQIGEELRVTRRTASNLMRELMEEDRVRREGHKKRIRYFRNQL